MTKSLRVLAAHSSWAHNVHEVDAMTQASLAPASSLGGAGFGQVGFGRAWFALTVAFALHVFDEATTGFLNVYNPTVLAMRERYGWWPMPTFQFREWLVGLSVGVVLCFALTPFAAQGARWLRPLAWLYAIIHFSNAMGHTIGTILGHTVATVTFPRPAPGFYSSPLLFLASVWLMVRLWRTSARAPVPASA
jgi:hypothetical protein